MGHHPVLYAAVPVLIPVLSGLPRTCYKISMDAPVPPLTLDVQRVPWLIDKKRLVPGRGCPSAGLPGGQGSGTAWVSPRPAVPAVLLCFSTGMQERWHCQRSGSYPMAPGMFVTWGWHCLQTAQQHAHPAPHARSKKVPRVQDTPCPDAFTGFALPHSSPPLSPHALSLVSPKFLCPHSRNAAEWQGQRPRQIREWRRQDATTHTLRLAGLVPGLPPSHPFPWVRWAPLSPAGTAFDFLVPCNVPL